MFNSKPHYFIFRSLSQKMSNIDLKLNRLNKYHFMLYFNFIIFSPKSPEELSGIILERIILFD